jgi:hypothetical protein
MAVKVEYRYEDVPGAKLVQHLEACTAEGWVLVSAERRCDLPTHVASGFDVIMRREK